jgi:hypothetical protein
MQDLATRAIAEMVVEFRKALFEGLPATTGGSSTIRRPPATPRTSSPPKPQRSS